MKILIALINSQPINRVDLCEKAGIDQSTFSRYKRLLLNNKVIKETINGYSLYNFVEKTNMWDYIRQNCLNAGAPLLDLKYTQIFSGAPDPTTGFRRMNTVNEVSIQGIIIPKGARELKAAAEVNIPDKYSIFLLTQASGDIGDRLSWENRECEIKDIEEIYDGNKFIYRIFKLV